MTDADWYVINKERLNEKRRKRYLEDQQYKERVLGYSKDWQKRKRKENNESRLSEGKLVPTQNPWRRLVKNLQGDTVELYTIGAVVAATGRTASTLRHWEQRGLIPRPQFKEGTYRLYSQAEIETITEYSKLVGE